MASRRQSNRVSTERTVAAVNKQKDQCASGNTRTPTMPRTRLFGRLVGTVGRRLYFAGRVGRGRRAVALYATRLPPSYRDTQQEYNFQWSIGIVSRHLISSMTLNAMNLPHMASRLRKPWNVSSRILPCVGTSPIVTDTSWLEEP